MKVMEEFGYIQSCKPRIMCFASGAGTIFRWLCEKCNDGTIFAEICGMICDRDCLGIKIAEECGVVPTIIPPVKGYGGYKNWSQTLFDHAEVNEADIVCLAGFIRKLWIPPEWENRVLNIHPSLLPKYGGKGMYKIAVHKAVLEAREKESGCTVHIVNQEYDDGPIIGQKKVNVYLTDTPETLQKRVQQAEQELYPIAIESFLRNKFMNQDNIKNKLIELVRTHALEYGDFTLKNGDKSSFYLDMRKLSLHSLGAKYITMNMWDALGDLDFEAIGGPSIGADPIVGAYLRECVWRTRLDKEVREVRGFLIRKEEKEHGKGGLVIGSVKPGDRVVVVEDVSTSGGSALRAVKIIEEFGCKVIKVLSVCDRDAGAKETIEKLGIPFQSILSINEILQ